MLSTRTGFRYRAASIFYRIEQNPNNIIKLGLSPAWSTTEDPLFEGS